MPAQPAAVELLTALAPVLANWGRWCVFGAQAVIAYGVPRLSADVDVTLALVPDAPERFARDMGEAFALADRVGVIEDGRLVTCDRPEVVAASRAPLVRQLLDAVPMIPRV